MIAPDDQLVRPFAALERRDHVVGRGHVPVERQLELDDGRTGADVIGDRQAAPPGQGRQRSTQGLEQRPGVGVGDRQDGDGCQGRGLGAVEPLGVRRGTDIRGERVTGEQRHVEDRPPLDAAVHPIRACRVDVAPEVPIVARIRVDEAADGALFGRHLRFDTAPGSAIACDDDLSPNIDAVSFEVLVVGRHAVVHVHQLARDVAVDRVGVVGRQLFTLLIRRGIFHQRRFLQRRREPGRCHELQPPELWCREQHPELLDLGVVPPFGEPGRHEIGHVLAEWGADVMRSRGEMPHPVAEQIGLECGIEAHFQRLVRPGT